MKTTLSLACLLLLGAQAIKQTPNDSKKAVPESKLEAPKLTPTPAQAAAPKEPVQQDLMLTTYIGFEFEGADLAEKFSALSDKQEDEVRLLVQDLIFDYWTEVGKPIAPKTKTLAQTEADCEADTD